MTNKHIASVFFNVLLVCASAVLLLPLFWIALTAMKSQAQALKAPLSLLPQPNCLAANFREVWGRADWLLYCRNSVLLAAGVWAAQMLVALPAAYAFAVMRFRGAAVLFVLVLVRLLVSPESAMLANYLTVLKLGAHDSLAGVALPYLLSAQAVLLFRGAFRQIPAALRDSARMDGCGDFRFMLRIGIPLIQPFIAAFSLVSVAFQWNAFFWPMLVTRSPSKRVLPVALAFFGMQAEGGSEWPLTMAAVLMVVTPLLIAFVILQKKFFTTFMKAWVH